MRVIHRKEASSISGGDIGDTFQTGVGVIWDAINGRYPAPFGLDFLTTPASGPTPGNVGGRYPASAIGQTPDISNVGGGQLGRSVAGALAPDSGGANGGDGTEAGDDNQEEETKDP